MKTAKIMLVVLTLTIFVLACTRTESPDNGSNESTVNGSETNAESVTPEKTDELASARKLYSDNCVKCHKEDGTGGEVEILGKTLDAEDFTTEKMKKESDAEYIEHITDGVEDEGMPSFKDQLSAEEIKDVVRFIREELQKS